MTARHLSVPATSTKVLELLKDLDWKNSEVADVGAGYGYFSQLLGERLKQDHGLEPKNHLSACDLIPSSFEWDGIQCQGMAEDGSLPFESNRFDVTLAIEVVEHVEDPFRFLRELARVTKPNGRVIVTTPNVLNINSRLRNLVWGFPVLFDPLPLEDQDIRYLGGHIHPIAPYFLAYAALHAGLYHPTFHADRAKRSATIGATLLWPLMALGRTFHERRIARKRPELLAQNRPLIDQQNSWKMLTSRTTILEATKSETPIRRRDEASGASASSEQSLASIS